MEQNIEFALTVADRVAILAQGRMVHIDKPEALRDPSLLAHHFFGAAGGGPVNPPAQPDLRQGAPA